MPFWKSAFVCLLSASLCFAETLPTETSTRLPVTRVILYKNGVGYFEHAGRVRGDQDINIDFTTAQLNDVLKSLTVLDTGNGRITGVSYNSTAPLERRLGSLRLPVQENPTTEQFLDALRGARLEVQNGSITVVGRLLSVDEFDPPAGDEKKKAIATYQLSVVTDSGEVRVFDLTPAISVRVLEKEVSEEVSKYLALIASSRDQDVRRMTLSTAGEGERGLLVSYISEVPVWKSTYRIIVPSNGKPLLQGWAIVDNTVGEDWKNIELSLVAGAPQSFVQELSQPFYVRRPEVPLPENAQLTPQTHEATIADESVPPPPPAPSGIVGGVPGGIPAGQMEGVVGSIVSKNALMAPTRIPGEPRFEADSAAKSLEEHTTVAKTRELGDLFEYKLKDHVTIHKNQSALVPILQTRIDAEQISVWNSSNPSALRALWVNNSSDLTFDGGTFNVLQGDAFAGEGLMDAIKPGEKRILSYAADLGLLVDAKQTAQNPRVTKVLINRGVMTQMTEERQELTYVVHNRDTSARTVLIEHPAHTGWKLTEGEVPVESSTSYHRFRVSVEPKKTATLLVKEYRPVSTRYEISNVTNDQINLFISQKMINPDVERSLRRIIAQKNEIASLDAEAASRRSMLTGMAENQQRVRENMKALKGSAEEKALVERYARELNEQEDRVQALQKEIQEIQGKRTTAQRTLNEMIEGLQMETTL